MASKDPNKKDLDNEFRQRTKKHGVDLNSKPEEAAPSGSSYRKNRFRGVPEIDAVLPDPLSRHGSEGSFQFLTPFR